MAYIVKVIKTNYVDEEEIIGELEIDFEDDFSFNDILNIAYEASKPAREYTEEELRLYNET